MKKLKLYTVVMLIAAAASAIVYLKYFGPRALETRVTVDPPAIVKQIQALDELVTVKYTVQKVIGLKEETGVFSSESVLMMVQAKVLGGIDLKAITAADVKLTTEHSVTIKLPPPKVINVSVDEKQTQVWDRSKTLWTLWVPPDNDLEKKARLVALEAVQAAALEMGLLRDAQQNAEKTIRGFLTVVGFESVIFESGKATPPTDGSVEAH